MSDQIDDTVNSAATVETAADYEKSPSLFVKHWMKAIELATSEEKDWRDEAEACLKRYRQSRNKTYNILYSNTQTTVPALYNSEPAPDVRRRFGDEDEVGEQTARLIERFLTIQCSLYDFDSCMQSAVKDRQLPGRGVTRVRVVMGDSGSKRLVCEPVIWDDYRRGPAKIWADVPWQAFRHRMTRDELVEKNAKIGKDIPLDSSIASQSKEGEKIADAFKRAVVWEIWDKAKRKIYWIAEGFSDGPLKVDEDAYKLRDFFPNPEPLYQVKQSDTLIPVCEFSIWRALADEIDDLTKRIAGIVKVMKLRGLYDGAFNDLIAKLKGLDDGELASADDSARAMQQGGLDKAIWLWPVDMAIKVVQGLYEAREQAKQQLYELTGIADILRGQSNPNETLGAQQIKAQWGSLRLQDAQKDVQRFARDLFRIMADLAGEVFEVPELLAITGLQVDPPKPPPPPPNAPPEAIQQVAQQYQQAVAKANELKAGIAKLLKSDLQREFAIDIETDSTIRADLTRAQENVSGFVTGLGAFMQSVAPAVQAGIMPPEVAVKLIGAFSRNFKLGREAEEAIDDWAKFLEQKAQQPQQPQQDPKLQADMARLQMEDKHHQDNMQLEQAKLQQDGQAKQAEIGMNAQIQREKMAQDAQLQREKMQHDAVQQEQKFHQQLQSDNMHRIADRENAVKMADNKARNDRMMARITAKPADESDQMQAVEDDAQEQGGSVAQSIEKLAQSVVQQGEDMKAGLTQMAQAMMAETELVRGADGKPSGARKVMRQLQ